MWEEKELMGAQNHQRLSWHRNEKSKLDIFAEIKESCRCCDNSDCVTDRNAVSDVTHRLLSCFVSETRTELAQGLQPFLYCPSILPAPGAIQRIKMTERISGGSPAAFFGEPSLV